MRGSEDPLSYLYIYVSLCHVYSSLYCFRGGRLFSLYTDRNNTTFSVSPYLRYRIDVYIFTSIGWADLAEIGIRLYTFLDT